MLCICCSVVDAEADKRQRKMMGFDAWRTGLAVLALLGVAQGACAGMRGILSRMRTGGKGWLGFYAVEFIFGWCCFGAMYWSFCRGVFSLDNRFFACVYVTTLAAPRERHSPFLVLVLVLVL